MKDGECLLALWILIADGDFEQGARFHDPKSGDLQREVLAVRALDQLFERRIVEGSPPRAVRGRLRRDLRSTRHAPTVVDVQCGLDVIRPDSAATQDQHRADEPNGRASVQASMSVRDSDSRTAGVARHFHGV